jgi:membrane protein implicated in regulation of membrane protease activity
MKLYVYWFTLALVLVGLEVATGTFYLLVIAIAIAIGGVAALLGFVFATQLALAALAGIVGISILRRWNAGQVSEMSQSLDIGQPVKILTWRDDATARVFYRGTEWDAELEDKDSGHDGIFYIKKIQGSVLILTHKNDLIN